MDPILELYREAAQDRPDALQFLLGWHHFCHAVDDLVDGDAELSAEGLGALLMHANNLYSTPFYLAHAAQLATLVAHVTNQYLDSVHWERSEILWQRQVADAIRTTGNDLILGVANIVGGFAHMRGISLRLRETSYHLQH